MLVVGAAAHLEEERAEEQQEYDRQDEPGQVDGGEAFHGDQPNTHDQQLDTGDQGHSPAGKISFSPARQASPYQAGTSSHAEPFIPQTQEHIGLDELLHMTSCPSAEFTNILEPFHVSGAQHVDHGSSSSAAPPPPPPLASDVQHGSWIPTYSSPPVMGYPVFDPSRVGSEYTTPPSYHAPSSYHSHSFDRHSAPTLTMTHPAPDPPALDTPAADPPPPPPSADLTGPPDLPLVVLEITFIHTATASSFTSRNCLCSISGLCNLEIGLEKLHGPIPGLQSPEVEHRQFRDCRAQN
ncbi:hypothetical protein PIB30_055278 [Stylosanthes scabra]|uniref:Uncharacterized protein n=1 Tax=Stylosanthes scabra TaxID=79078 RepID=A0ABU6UKL7_9FABA|nr:hypothetical protein [Stylosanthes scabra]